MFAPRPSMPFNKSPVAQLFPKFIPTMSRLYEGKAQLLQLRQDQPNTVGDRVSIKIIQRSNFSSFLEVIELSRSRPLLSADLPDIINLQFQTSQKTCFFDIRQGREREKQLLNFAFCFSSVREMRDFVFQYTRAVFECAAQRRSTESDLPELERFFQYYSLDFPVKEFYHEPKFHSCEYVSEGSGDGGRNVLLRLGRSRDLALVVRRYENQVHIGMFSAGGVFRRAIPKVRYTDTKPIMVTDMLSVANDKSLLLLNENRKGYVHELELREEEPVIARDIRADPMMDFKGILPRKRGDFSSKEFIAFSEQNVAIFDARRSGYEVEKSAYKTNCEFSCGITTASGKLAMGSENGVVRLYDRPCRTRATVNFQVNCGADKVLAIDVSPDEQWVLATCKYYLSVFNVWAPSVGKSGFDAPMGKDKPALTRLAIWPEDQQKIARYFGGDLPPFAPAKFEVQYGRVVTIVAGIGNALVIWDFRKIESESLPTYRIKLVGGEAIAACETLAGSTSILFISDNQVSVIERSGQWRR
jgi:hypothetical protein